MNAREEDAAGPATRSNGMAANRRPSATPIPFRLPVSAFALAHLAAAVAFAALILDPEAFLLTHLHPHVLRAVHAFTLGWITLTAVGATWVVGHLALSMRMRATRLDGVAVVALAVGALGVAFHMGDGLWRGVGWSGLAVLMALLWLALRVWHALWRATSPIVIRLHVAAAYANLLLASGLGTAIAFAWLPPHVPHTVALVLHAHVAVVGFATLLAVGVGYRLLPMILPAAPPPAPVMWTSLIALQAGVLSFLVRLFVDSTAVGVSAGAALSVGVLAFLVGVGSMLARRRPPPRDLRRPDPAALLVLQAVVSLLAALVVGLWLAGRPEPAAGPRATVYGALGLVGFLGQMIAGVGFRLLPWLAWRHAFDAGVGAGGSAHLPTPPNAMGWCSARWVAVGGWGAGLVLMVSGLGSEAPALLRASGCALVLAVLAGVAHLAVLVRHCRSDARAARAGAATSG